MDPSDHKHMTTPRSSRDNPPFSPKAPLLSADAPRSPSANQLHSKKRRLSRSTDCRRPPGESSLRSSQRCHSSAARPLPPGCNAPAHLASPLDPSLSSSSSDEEDYPIAVHRDAPLQTAQPPVLSAHLSAQPPPPQGASARLPASWFNGAAAGVDRWGARVRYKGRLKVTEERYYPEAEAWKRQWERARERERERERERDEEMELESEDEGSVSAGSDAAEDDEEDDDGGCDGAKGMKDGETEREKERETEKEKEREARADGCEGKERGGSFGCGASKVGEYGRESGGVRKDG
ncbi:unnamed protein product, partial [Closterium sp. NIES-53]